MAPSLLAEQARSAPRTEGLFSTADSVSVQHRGQHPVPSSGPQHPTRAPRKGAPAGPPCLSDPREDTLLSHQVPLRIHHCPNRSL